MAFIIKIMKYTIDARWYPKNGQAYADLEWETEEETYPSIKAAIDYIISILEWEYEGSMLQRTADEPNPCILHVINDEGNVVYRVANCSEKTAKEYGIKADKYIETLKEEE